MNGRVGVDPRLELAAALSGPVSDIPLGLVALPEEAGPVRSWMKLMGKLLMSRERNARRYRPFPGTEKAFGRRFILPAQFVRTINRDHYEAALAEKDPNRRFDRLLELFGSAVCSLFNDVRPACVLVALPDILGELRVSNPRLTERERRALERLQQEDDKAQLELFKPSKEDFALAEELRPQADELLFRNFYRALKARCMNAFNAVPLQVLRRHAYITAEASQSEGTRAWNLAISLLYKSGHIPWQPAELDERTCYVGISFHHLQRRAGDIVYASLAQAYSSRHEPFALKGASVPRDQRRDRQPYLKRDEARILAERITKTYEIQTGSKPARVVLHKTSRYQPEEEAGFKEAFEAEIPACELVWMGPTGLRLLRRGMIEPYRGTLCSIGGDSFLFTSGFVPWWQEYPGPHIPAPLQFGVSGTSDLRERANEILALSKMNWNSADGVGRLPITISFARKVGTIMTEIEEENPNPLYRFYM